VIKYRIFKMQDADWAVTGFLMHTIDAMMAETLVGRCVHAEVATGDTTEDTPESPPIFAES
jgi:hypothetical protein